MDETSIMRSVLAAIRRQWWLIVVPALVAAGVVAVAGGAQEPGYVAETSMFVDVPNVLRYSTAPSPDHVIRASSPDGELGQRIKVATGISGDELSDLRLYSLGDEQSRLVVRFVHPDEERSREVVELVTLEIVSYVHDLVEPDLIQRRTQLANHEQALDEIEREGRELQENGQAWEASDLAFKLWNVRSSVIEAANMLRVLEGLYLPDTPVTVEEESAARGRLALVAAAAFIGLAAGVLMAVVRERVVGRARNMSA